MLSLPPPLLDITKSIWVGLNFATDREEVDGRLYKFKVKQHQNIKKTEAAIEEILTDNFFKIKLRNGKDRLPLNEVSIFDVPTNDKMRVQKGAFIYFPVSYYDVQIDDNDVHKRTKLSAEIYEEIISLVEDIVTVTKYTISSEIKSEIRKYLHANYPYYTKEYLFNPYELFKKQGQ